MPVVPWSMASSMRRDTTFGACRPSPSARRRADRPGIIAGVAERLAAHGGEHDRLADGDPARVVRDRRWPSSRAPTAPRWTPTCAQRGRSGCSRRRGRPRRPPHAARGADRRASPSTAPTTPASSPPSPARSRDAGVNVCDLADPPGRRAVRDAHRGRLPPEPGLEDARRRLQAVAAGRSVEITLRGRSTPTSFDPRRHAASAPAAHARAPSRADPRGGRRRATCWTRCARFGRCVGIAAPQIGELVRVAVRRLRRATRRRPTQPRPARPRQPGDRRRRAAPRSAARAACAPRADRHVRRATRISASRPEGLRARARRGLRGARACSTRSTTSTGY